MSQIPEFQTLTSTNEDHIAAQLLSDERREGSRRSVTLQAKLVGPFGEQAFTCDAENLAEAGLHIRIPVESGLCVGQRYEVRFEAGTLGDTLSHLAGESRFATVVRTEPSRFPDSQEMGVGLRFDQPLFL
jgi:hypothetical protein